VPSRFRMAADFVLNTDLRRQFESGAPDAAKCRMLIEEVGRTGTALDKQTLEFALRRTIERAAGALASDPGTIEPLRSLNTLVEIARSLPFSVDLWYAQNVFYSILSTSYQGRKEAAGNGDESSQAWVPMFESLGANLRVRVIGA
ncbi:MAG: DUF3536 domain-containing protein, partial [Bryobacteraceae bacterium]